MGEEKFCACIVCLPSNYVGGKRYIGRQFIWIFWTRALVSSTHNIGKKIPTFIKVSYCSGRIAPPLRASYLRVPLVLAVYLSFSPHSPWLVRPQEAHQVHPCPGSPCPGASMHGALQVGQPSQDRRPRASTTPSARQARLPAGRGRRGGRAASVALPANPSLTPARVATRWDVGVGWGSTPSDVFS